jgi:hypothetical protein
MSVLVLHRAVEHELDRSFAAMEVLVHAGAREFVEAVVQKLLV